MKFLISISYDGSKYHGLQKLNDKNTVQGELEHVLTILNENPVSIKAAGRTDKGVHALDQKCHFELDKKITPFKLKGYLNRSTSPYLYINDCQIIEDRDFHARFSVKKKTYLYKINIGKYSPIENDYVYNFNKDLNIEAMRFAAKIIEGPHSYKAFVTDRHKTYDSIIDYIKIKKVKNIIEIEVKGKAFYTHMVRNIAKILVLAGSNNITNKQIEEMLETGKRVVEYAPAPASGLYLKKIEY